MNDDLDPDFDASTWGALILALVVFTFSMWFVFA